MLDLLVKLVHSGDVVCPLSFQAFLELLRQEDRESRAITADVMDALSQQIAFISPAQIVEQEIIGFVRNGEAKLSDLSAFENSKYVWTKVPFIIGELFPNWPEVGERDQDVPIVREAFLEFYSKITLRQMIDGLPNGFRDKSWASLAERLNVEKDQHQSWQTFQEVYLYEVAGMVDAYREEVERISLYLFEAERGQKLSPSVVSQLGCAQILSNLIYQVFAQKKVGRQLPSIHIHATFAAQFRHDKAQRYKANDLIDIGHTAWALPYCHYFFTEKKFADMIRKTKLDSLYGTKVLSAENEVLDALTKLM